MIERSQKLIYSKFRKSQLSTKKFLSWMILGREDFWVHKVMTESWILVVWLWCKQWLQNITCMEVPEKFVHVYEPASQDEANRCELCKKNQRWIRYVCILTHAYLEDKRSRNNLVYLTVKCAAENFEETMSSKNKFLFFWMMQKKSDTTIAKIIWQNSTKFMRIAVFVCDAIP